MLLFIVLSQSKPKKTKKAPAKKRAAKKDAESDNEEPEEVRGFLWSSLYRGVPD